MTPSELERQTILNQGYTVVGNLKKGYDDTLIQWANQEGKTVYIGRYHKWGKPPIPQSKWYNPFRSPQHGNLDTICHAYADYLARQPQLMAAIPELKGKLLCCWCYPEQCHGDHLAKLANNL